MNDEPTMIDETEDLEQHRRSPRRSWKIFQLVVAGLLTAFVVSMTLTDQWGETFGGATKAQIAEFERTTSEYFDAVERRGLTEVSMRSYNLIEPDEAGRVAEIEKGTHEARERVLKSVDRMSSSNMQKARARFGVEAYDHNRAKILPAEVVLEMIPGEARPWVMRSVTAGIWLALKTAAITFAAAWLFLKLCELFWWFFIDRLRDVADAVRKS